MSGKTRSLVRSVAYWLRSRRRQILICVAGGIFAVLVVQLAFPRDRAVPFSSALGEPTDFASREDIVATIQNKFAISSVVLKSRDKEYREQLSSCGATISPSEMASEVLEYPLMWRLIPFSLLWYQPSVDHFTPSFEPSRVEVVAENAHKELTSKPRNASLTIKDGELVVESAADGHIITKEMVTTAITTGWYDAGETIKQIDGKHTTPNVSDEAIARIRQQAEAVLDHKVVIRVDQKEEFNPTRNDIATWITIDSQKNGTVTLTLSDKKIKDYVLSVNKKVAVAPKPTKVNLRDGKEVDRTKGTPGSALDVSSVAKSIRRTIESTETTTTLDVSTQPIKPPINYVRSYTSSQAGLTTYVSDTTAKGDIKIAVTQLGGSGMSADGGASDSIPAASTYKLYVMQRVFDDVERDSRNWDDQIVDSSLSNCFERMIVVSANECAEELIRQYGPNNITDYLHQRGYSSGTSFVFSDATRTTAYDLNKYLVKLENGRLISSQHRTMLLEKMGRQIYRKGIPAGSSGTVYNKVGFLWDYNHDAAIVRHPRGTYVLVVMTKGHSFDKIAEITRQIEKILYP